MKEGDKVILIPGSSRLQLTGSLAYKALVIESMKSMTEEVVIMRLDTNVGNAKVRDKKGIAFYCNRDDLRPTYEEFFNPFHCI